MSINLIHVWDWYIGNVTRFKLSHKASQEVYNNGRVIWDSVEYWNEIVRLLTLSGAVVFILCPPCDYRIVYVTWGLFGQPIIA